MWSFSQTYAIMKTEMILKNGGKESWEIIVVVTVNKNKQMTIVY